MHRGRDQARYADGTRALLAYGAGVSDQQYARALRQRDELTAAIDASLDGVAALAGPAVGYTAPEQDPPFGTDADHGEGRFTGPYNLSGHPALSLPVPAPACPPGSSWPAAAAGTWRCSGWPPRRKTCWPATNPDDRPKEPAPMPTTVSYRTLDLAGAGVPVIELAGAQDGPRLVVLAGVHGCEYAPMAAVRRWARELGGRELRGHVTAVPVLNLPAFRSRTPFVTPDDGKNLNRCFPGDPSGTFTDRLADAVFRQLITGAGALIDVHAGDMVEALEPFALYDTGPGRGRAPGTWPPRTGSAT